MELIWLDLGWLGWWFIDAVCSPLGGETRPVVVVLYLYWVYIF